MDKEGHEWLSNAPPRELVANQQPSANPLRFLAFTSVNSPALFAHSFILIACPTFPCPISSPYGIIVLQLALRHAQPPCPRPRRHRFSTSSAQLRISHGSSRRERARWSHSSQLHPTRHGPPMAPACICKHLNRLLRWSGARESSSLSFCLSRGLSEGTKAASRAGKKSSLSAANVHLVASRPHAGTCSGSFHLACLL